MLSGYESEGIQPNEPLRRPVAESALPFFL